MMKPDDESASSLNSLDVGGSKTHSRSSSNANSLINEAFNLSSSFANLQPMVVLPPSNSTHFQPISSRTPTSDAEASKPSQAASFFDQLDNKGSPATVGASHQLFKPVKSESNQSANTSFSSESSKPPNGLNQSPVAHVAALTSIGPPPVFNPVRQIGTLPPQPNLPPNIPPLNIPHVPPPIAPVAPTTGGSNPYSAKGALNKKVYDTSIVPTALSPPSVLSTMLKPDDGQIQSNTATNGTNLFIPPAIPSQNNTPNTGMTPSASSASLVNPIFPPTSMAPLPQAGANHLAYSNSSFSIGVNQPIDDRNMQPVINQMATSLSFSSGDSLSQNESTARGNDYQNKTRNVWNYFSGNQFFNTVVEKAKSSVQSIVTAVDPQMKDFIHPANRPLYLISSMSNPKIGHIMRDAFVDAGFNKITTHAFDAQNTTQMATQIVGFENALRSAREKLDNALYLMQNQPDCLIFSFQDFLAELTPGSWFELAVIVFKDKVNNIEMTVYTEALPVPIESINQLQQYTPAEYPLKWSGFSCRLPEKNFNYNAPVNGSSSYLNYDTNETIVSQVRLSHALKTLALSYKNKLIGGSN